ncbi:MAG: hypothetical protein Kow0096_21470 [Thiohalomonadaceae bacterium]
MGMPTEQELKEALAEAGRMREQGDDPHHIAKALLNLNYRVKSLEKVLEAAELFYRSGQSVTEHQRLKRAIAEARAATERSAGMERESFGLE